jgi:hypothetical protein
MCRTSFESFIRFGGTKTFVLNLANSPVLELKQDGHCGVSGAVGANVMGSIGWVVSCVCPASGALRRWVMTMFLHPPFITGTCTGRPPVRAADREVAFAER